MKLSQVSLIELWVMAVAYVLAAAVVAWSVVDCVRVERMAEEMGVYEKRPWQQQRRLMEEDLKKERTDPARDQSTHNAITIME
ncbi:MAG: hypothetical protein JXR78_01835 [Victivallales bacterium]|nr:hypothetical protein [Victivallales bacterium]